jgi:hypothetical protein
MKLKTILLTLLLSFGLSGVAYADAGLDAALKGDYKTAIKEWHINIGYFYF